MLAEAVIAAYKQPISDGYHKGQLTVTGVSPCTYATYLNFKHTNDEVFDAESTLRMKNGKYQEIEVLEDLIYAGFVVKHTGRQQLLVNVGPIKGRPDGLILVDGKEDLLEIKSMSLQAFTTLKQKGVKEGFPGYYCQVQLYMASVELLNRVEGCRFYAKHKDTCRPFDVYITRDLNYSQPIIEEVTKIVRGGEVKKPPSPINLCPKCRHRLYCWAGEIYDTSSSKVVDMPQVVDKWMQGQFHLDLGKEYNEEARVILKQLLGDDEVAYCQGTNYLLQVRKIIQRRSEIDLSKFVQIFGAHRLVEVMKEKEFTQVRVSLKE